MTRRRVPRVVLGFQGPQMPANAIRGIGRWAQMYGLSMQQHHRDLLAGISIDDRLPLPTFVTELDLDVPVFVAEEHLEVDVQAGERLVFHQLSVFEDLDLSRLWPAWARDPRVASVVTVHDMIPALFPEDHFAGPARHLLQARFDLIRAADAVVTNSGATADDVVRLLGADEKAVFVAPAQVSRWFEPYPRGRVAATALVPPELGIEADFVLSVGNVDRRKNLSGLMRAYAALPPELRRRHQLVLTASQAGADHERRILDEATELGIGDRVVTTRFIDDDVLLRLYQSCYAMVFPSQYEGLGLPVIEAMRCGAAVLASDIAPFRPLVPDPEARFDPHDVDDLTEKLRRILDEPAFAVRRRQAAAVDSVGLGWEPGCSEVVTAYQHAASRRP